LVDGVDPVFHDDNCPNIKLRVGLYIDVDEISRRATAICSTQHCIKRMAGKRMAKSLKALSMLIRIGLYWFPLAILVALAPAPATVSGGAKANLCGVFFLCRPPLLLLATGRRASPPPIQEPAISCD
jgi:hypothetical protein